MNELVTELREYKKQAPWSPCGRAADKIERLMETNGAMEGVLAKIGRYLGVDPGDVDGLFIAIESFTNASDEDSQ